MTTTAAQIDAEIDRQISNGRCPWGMMGAMECGTGATRDEIAARLTERGIVRQQTERDRAEAAAADSRERSRARRETRAQASVVTATATRVSIRRARRCADCGGHDDRACHCTGSY